MSESNATSEVLSSPHDRDALIPEPAPLGPVRWGVIAFLFSEFAFFSTLIVAYITFLHADQTGPKPAILSLPLVIGTTICLLSRSATIHFAERGLRSGAQRTFLIGWFATILLGVLFLVGTAFEWHGLIAQGLTIGRNLFGTTYYTLVGFHALHVTGGVIAMSIVLGLGLRGRISAKNHLGAEMVAWYWHFVDVVWIAVFTLVYLIGR